MVGRGTDAVDGGKLEATEANDVTDGGVMLSNLYTCFECFYRDPKRLVFPGT